MLKTISLKERADDKRVLSNPHKGWYWHYYDNGMKRPMYRDKTPKNEDYKGFPGLNHLYLRVDWSDIQPTPNAFDWSKIDSVMEKWGALGYNFSFRVCCNETWPVQCFAAPKWLYEMGCKGNFYKRGDSGGILTDEHGGGTWEPDYGDPLFLKYLDKFIRKFAEKYDGDSRVEYVDIGSYGNWGEGHTYFGSKKCFGLDVLKCHAAIHARHIKKTPILVNDDFIMQMYDRPDEEKIQLRDFCLSLGFGIRDDSVLVGSWDYRRYHNVEHPELFKMFSKNAPANIELAHFNHYTSDLAKGGMRIIEAARCCRATYIGFHGYPDEWLNENYYVTQYLANRLGYWFFINRITHNETVTAYSPAMIEIEFENRGFAPCYNKFDFEIKFTEISNRTEHIYHMDNFDIRTLLEGKKYRARFFPRLSGNMPEGKYIISLRLYDALTSKPVSFAVKDEYIDTDGFFSASEIYVKQM